MAWAEAVHHDTDTCGIVWMSCQFKTDQAYLFFGDRVSADDLEPLEDHGARREFSIPDDADWLSGLADQIGVTLTG